MSQILEKLPLAGKVFRGSNRAYTGFLNKLRADSFDSILGSAKEAGVPITSKLLTSLGSFVSNATGRGKLGALEGAAVALNTAFFSPRLMASRLNLLNPLYYTKLHPTIRKEALKSLATVVGGGTTILGLAKMGGADVEANPTNADFGKIKVGNTRYDPWGGFQQYVRTLAQLTAGEVTSSTTGVKMVTGEGYKPLTRYDILARSIEMKEAPVVSFVTNVLKGKTMGKKTLDVGAEVKSRFIPMVIQDIWDIKEDKGWENMWMGLPAIVGVGIQTYSPNAYGVVSAFNSVKNNATKLIKQGRQKEAFALWNKNEKFIRQGIQLTPYTASILALERVRNNMSKNPNISKQQKKINKDIYNNAIIEQEIRLEKAYEDLKSKESSFRPIGQPQQDSFRPIGGQNQ